MAGFVVGVTGGVASGKSAITALFEKLGIVVADADLAARAVVSAGEPALAEIAERFGPDILLADGSLDRARMRAMAFAEPGVRKQLEAITHPRIRLLLESQCRNAPGPYAVAAIPLLAETGAVSAYPWLRRILVVDSPASLQRARLVSRDDIDPTLADQMIAAQASREKRLKLATDVLVNDGSLDELVMPVARLDRLYRHLAADA